MSLWIFKQVLHSIISHSNHPFIIMHVQYKWRGQLLEYMKFISHTSIWYVTEAFGTVYTWSYQKPKAYRTQTFCRVVHQLGKGKCGHHRSEQSLITTIRTSVVDQPCCHHITFFGAKTRYIYWECNKVRERRDLIY